MSSERTPEERYGWRVVRANNGAKDPSFQKLERVTHVHVHGHLYLWAVKLLLGEAPRLQQIRLIPSVYARIAKGQHITLCVARGVEVIQGHFKPQCAWVEGENRSTTYSSQRKFFLSLDGEQKQRWEDLLAFEFDPARLTARYFCLAGEPFIPGHEIASAHGYSAAAAPNIASAQVNAVIHYLDPSFECGEIAQRMALSMASKIERIHQQMQDAEYPRRFAAQLGVERLPENLPRWRWETFADLIRAKRDGRIARLRDALRVPVERRFGLVDGEYRTCQAVGDELGLTRERIRQIEEQVLALLGIEEAA